LERRSAERLAVVDLTLVDVLVLVRVRIRTIALLTARRSAGTGRTRIASAVGRTRRVAVRPARQGAGIAVPARRENDHQARGSEELAHRRLPFFCLRLHSLFTQF